MRLRGEEGWENREGRFFSSDGGGRENWEHPISIEEGLSSYRFLKKKGTISANLRERKKEREGGSPRIFKKKKVIEMRVRGGGTRKGVMKARHGGIACTIRKKGRSQHSLSEKNPPPLSATAIYRKRGESLRRTVPTRRTVSARLTLLWTRERGEKEKKTRKSASRRRPPQEGKESMRRRASIRGWWK